MRLSIGTVQFGLNYGIHNKKGIVTKKESHRILKTAGKNAIDLIDTAQAYGDSESLLGSLDLPKFNFVTKLRPGILVSEVFASVKKSCKYLDVKDLEGVLVHDFRDYYEKPKIVDELIRLKEGGIVKKIGFSLYYPCELDQLFSQNIEFDILQIPFSIYDQRFKKYFGEIKKRNIEIHVRSVFLQGLVFLEPDKLPQHFVSQREQFLSFKNKCSQLNQPISSVCLNYVYSHHEIDRVVIGVCSSKELLQNINQIKDNLLDFNESKFSKFKITDESIILPFNWKIYD